MNNHQSKIRKILTNFGLFSMLLGVSNNEVYSQIALKNKSILNKRSAANYIKKIGWKTNSPCFVKIDLKKEIPDKYLNTSARQIKNKKKVKFFKKFIKNSEDFSSYDNLVSAIITPDKDIIPGSKKLKPAYLVFNNYELILKWNRSLRFALAVCTLKNKFENEI